MSHTTVGNTMADDTTVGDSVTNTNNSSGEGSSAIVSDLSNISVDVVGVVVDVLDPSVGQVDGVVSLPGSGAIVGLLGVKTGSRVIVSHGILVGVGGDLVRVDLNGMGNGVSNCMTNDAMANAHSVANANTMADANSMAKANSMANSSKELSRGSSHKGGDRNESLMIKVRRIETQRKAREIKLNFSTILWLPASFCLHSQVTTVGGKFSSGELIS